MWRLRQAAIEQVLLGRWGAGALGRWGAGVLGCWGAGLECGASDLELSLDGMGVGAEGTPQRSGRMFDSGLVVTAAREAERHSMRIIAEGVGAAVEPGNHHARK